MTEADVNLAHRVAKHFEMANRERAKFLENAGNDPLAQFSAMLDGQAVFIRALSEATIDLAREVVAIRHQLDRLS